MSSCREVFERRPWLAAVALCMPLSSAVTAAPTALAQQAPRAPDVRITPNAIQQRDVPMIIDLAGAPGQTLYFFILRDCDGDPATPELHGNAGCVTPLHRQIFVLDDTGGRQIALRLDDNPHLPDNQNLWVRVSSVPSGDRAYQDALFGLVDEPCSLWATIISAFGAGDCSSGLAEAFGPQRSYDGQRPAVPLEARRLVLPSGNTLAGKPVPVPGTRGATGVTWLDPDSLLVTVGASPPDILTAVDTAPEPVTPGLYRVDVATGKGLRLVAQGEGEILTAPFALGPDAIAFVRERVVVRADGTVASLVIWRGGRASKEIPLRRSIHQILAADPRGARVLAYSRWQGIPSLLEIDLATGAATELGFPPQLFHALMRRPGGSEVVLALEDNAGYNGWELILVDGDGRLAAELAVGARDDLMPAWRPGRREIVYLGQAGEGMEVP
jgi:hypothetical protein